MARVMVVDDDHAIASALEMCLTLAGHEVVVEHNGLAALTRLHAAPPPDLLLVDLLLPGRTGRQIIEDLAAHPDLCRTPVIITTATARQELFPAPGPHRFVLRKPFELTDLLETVARALAPEAEAGQVQGDGTPSHAAGGD